MTTLRTYYMLSRAAPSDGNSALITYDDPNDEELLWTAGQRFEHSPQVPIVATVEVGDGGVLPTLNTSPLCLMTKSLAEALRGAGVDNIDFYRAEIHDLESRQVHHTHLAFNLVGVVRL